MFLKRILRALSASALIFAAACGPCGAADLKIYDWKSHTSMLNVAGAEYDPASGAFWAVTEGGAYKYLPSTGAIAQYRNDSSLTALSFKAVKFNPADSSIYLGSTDGALEIISQGGTIEHINDIRNSEQFSNRSINSIVFKGNTAYLGCGFGIAALDANEKVFVETITKIGTAAPFEPVKKILIAGGKIWALMSGATAYADINSFLANPNSWTVIDLPNGTPIDMAEASGKMYFAIDSTIYEFQDSVFLPRQSTWFNITNLQSKGGEIYWAIPWEVNRLGQVGGGEYLDYSKFMNGFAFTGGGLISYTLGAGMTIVNGADTLRILPKTPAGNEFFDLTVSPEGELWAAGISRGAANGGVSVQKDGEWLYFNQSNSQLAPPTFNRVSTAPGKVSISSWGAGLAIGKKSADTIAYTRYNNNNSAFKGVSNVPDYVVVGQTEFDSRGTLWAVNYGETSEGPLLVAIDSLGVSYGFVNCRDASNRYVLPLAIDNYGTKWIGSTNGGGLYYYNESGTFADRSDDECGSVTNYAAPALAANEINCLALDRTGSLWIGTPKGLTQFLNPQTVLSTKPSYFMRAIKFLNGESINDIYVDATNNKWIASNKGVWLLSPEGDSLAHIDRTNSPLSVDQILSIAGNPETGQMYFGTNAGLFEAKTLFAAPLADFDIKVYPQPFTPTAHGDMFIEGLAENSEIRILTVGGDFVRSINALGRRAVWDGRDSRGFEVPTGVYIIIATSSTNKSGAQKVAVKR
ncbi:MAG: two-component regulator propeller domain-containing protein [Chloroflexota bacterium]